MKRKTVLICMLLSCVIALYAGNNVLDYLTASSDGSRITVEWRRSDERDVQNYVIEKSISGKKFETVHTEKARGNSSGYRWVDDNPYFKDACAKPNNKIQGDGKFSYRVQVLHNDNSRSYSEAVNVTQKINSIKRTWGMIKEMFR